MEGTSSYAVRSNSSLNRFSHCPPPEDPVTSLPLSFAFPNTSEIFNTYDGASFLNDSLFPNGSLVNGTLAPCPEYDYPTNDSHLVFNWSELAPILTVYALSYVVGVSGNALIIYTILHFRRLKSTTNVFLISLSSADLLLVLVCIPVKLARLFSYTWTLGLTTCKLVYYVQTVSAFCSVLTLVAISLERYYAIVYPLRAQYRCTMSKARKICICIWLLALLLAAPVLAVQVHMEVGLYVTAYWCVRDFDSRLLWPGYETYAFVLLLALPLVIMGAAYSAICSAVFSMVETRREMSNGLMLSKSTSFGRPPKRVLGEDRNEMKQVVTMLVVVVALFVLCWAPILTINVLKAYQFIPPYSLSIKHLTTAADLLSYINSCLNPIIYGFMSRHFREGFMNTVCCCGRGKNNRGLLKQRGSVTSTRLSTVRLHDTRVLSCHGHRPPRVQWPPPNRACPAISYIKTGYCDDVSINDITVC